MRAYSEHEARNKEIVLDYYDKLVHQWDFDAASIYLGDSFIQHNPAIADGREGLERTIRNVPDFIRAHMRIEHRRVMVDGDMVMVHSYVHFGGAPGGKPGVMTDIFRLENGKVMEHWDVIMDIPEQKLHENPPA